MKYYLAVDIGASSGRHILSWVENGVIKLEEIYRFPNKTVKNGDYLCWDLEYLGNCVLNGLAECKRINKIPETIGIDTWAVDFVLLDKDDKIIGETVAYRDSRTNGMDKKIEKTISFKELYAKTGIQKQLFNTVYQLTALKNKNPDYLEKAETFLMIPDYLNFMLCGVKANEYTNATSTALVNAEQKDWDFDLINKLGFPSKIFQPLKTPKTVLGGLKSDIVKRIGFDCKVILPATHDTGSAFMAVPAKDDNAVYISSGTWSLLGVENTSPIVTEKSADCNFTNEGGYDYKFRYLKNIMGLWMLQSVRRELGDEYSFARLEQEAACADYNDIIDVNDSSFLAPKSMINAVKNYCKNHNKKIPTTPGETAKCIYLGLADCYKNAVKTLEELTNKKFTSINIVGGGSQDNYLNRLTATSCGLPVYAGPTEGTALGNLMAQMIANGEFSSLKEARKSITESFEIKEIKPQ